MSPLLRLAALVALVVLAGCSPEPPRPQAKVAPPTPIARLNTSVLTVPRIDFCGLLPKSAVEAAVGSSDWTSRSYANGDQAPVTASTDDIVAEHLCVWAANNGGDQARAWVFARPVDAGMARAVVRGEERAGCRTSPGPGFGDPSVTQECRLTSASRVRHEGLFGDTWLGCEVSGPVAALDTSRTRADAWCVEVANALNTSR